MTKASILLKLLEQLEIGDKVYVDLNKLKKQSKSKYFLKAIKGLMKKGLVVSGIRGDSIIVRGDDKNRSVYKSDNYIIQKDCLSNST